MIDNIKMEKTFRENNIHPKKENNDYTININGSEFIIGIEEYKGDKLLSIFWREKSPSQRTIDLTFLIDDEGIYDSAMSLLIVLIEIVTENKGEIPMKNEKLRQTLYKYMTKYGLVSTRNHIDGVNTNVQDIDLDDDDDEPGELLYHEIPATRQELLELRDKAAAEKNKEDWEKYQKMLLDMDGKNENVSFKYLKNFRNFEN